MTTSDMVLRYVEINYESENGKNILVTIPFEAHRDSEQKELMEEIMAEIIDDGGFWLNEKVIIPHWRIYSLKYISDKRGTSTTTTTTIEDKKQGNCENHCRCAESNHTRPARRIFSSRPKK